MEFQKDKSKTNENLSEKGNNSSPGALSFNIDKLIKGIIFLLVTTEIVLILLDLIIAWRKVIPLEDIQLMFDLSEEQSLGTWFMVIQNFTAGLILFFIYIKKQSGSKKNTGWLILSLIFIYLSIDDSICIHERSSDILSDLTYYSKTLDNLTDKIFAPFPYYFWQIIMGPFFVLIASFMLYFLWKELKDLYLRRYLFLAFLCLINAVIMDFMEGMEKPLLFISDKYSLTPETVQHFWMLTEECLEMFGITLLLYIFLKYLGNLLKDRKLHFL